MSNATKVTLIGGTVSANEAVSSANPLPISGSISATNPSVAQTGTVDPGYATEIGIIVGGNLVGVSASNPLPISGTISATSAINATATLPTLSPGSQAPQGSLAGATYVQPVFGSASGGGTQVDATHGLPVLNLAGANIIGKVGIDQTTPGTTNAVDVTNLPVTVDTNSGNKSASTLRVVLATDQPTMSNAQPVTISAGSAVIGHVITDSGSVAAVTNAGTFAVQLTGATNNINNIAGTVSLPTGAATAAKQPALGTAGSASADVITVQGIASMTALKVDGSGSTQPISGTVTANAGTNLNTSLLALESGGNLATLAGGVSASVYQENIKQVNGVTVLTGTGATGTGCQRVTVAGDSATVAGSSSIPAGTNLIGKVGIDQTTAGTTNAISLSQINTATTLAGNGVTGTGAQRVTIASDNTGIANWGQGATAAAVPSGASYQGLLAKTANPSAASDGNLTGAMGDKLGRQVVVIGQVRDLKGNQYTALGSSSETTVVTAVASTFLDVYGVIAANTTGSAVTLTFKDSTGGTTQFVIYVPAGDTRGLMLPSSDAFKQTTVNTNWTCTGGASGVDITMLYCKNI